MVKPADDAQHSQDRSDASEAPAVLAPESDANGLAEVPGEASGQAGEDAADPGGGQQEHADDGNSPAPGTSPERRAPSDRRHAIVVALITATGAIIAAIILAIVPNLLNSPSPTPSPDGSPTKSVTPRPSPTRSPGPPSPSAVTMLMNEDAEAAMTRKLAIVNRIYAPDAFVKDAACQSPGQSTTWRRLPQIRARYRALPEFSSLQHEFAQVRFIPDTARATRATATAQTVGHVKPSATSPSGNYIHGDEKWTFARVGGQWLITSFTYNVCYPTSAGG